jgi:DNA-binding response OmpR family regulator
MKEKGIFREKKSLQRILVVDDDMFMRAFNTAILIRFGYEVDAAADSVVGWETLQAKPYDLLITDHSIPRISGVELVDKMHAAGMAVPVIMATAVVPEQEFKRKPWLREVTMLLSPFTTNDLLFTVQKVLRKVVPLILSVILGTSAPGLL